MSSRVYITNKLPEHYDAISKGHGNWDVWVASTDILTSGYISHMVDTNKYGDPRTNLDATVSPTVRPYRIGMYAGVSRAILRPQAFHTFKLVLAVAQTTNSQVYTKIHMYLLDSTAGLQNGVFYRSIVNYEDGPATASEFSKLGVQWPYVPDPFASRPAPIVLTFNGIWPIVDPIPVPPDEKEYRLVVEIGAISYATSGDVGLQHRFGVRYDNMALRDDILSAEGATYVEWDLDVQFDNYKELPPNHEIELATTIPLGLTQIVNSPYRYYYRWYKYTPPADTVLSLQACSTVIEGGSSLQLYMQETPGQVPNVPAKDWGVSGSNVVFNHAVQANRALLIKTRPVSQYVYNWSLNLVQSPNVTVKKGDLFISTDEYNDNLYDPTIKGLYPVIWHSPTLGDIRVLSGKYAGTRVGACLSNGKWALSQPLTGEIFLYKLPPFLDLLERIQTEMTGGISTIGTDLRDFYVLGRVPNFNAGENRTVIRILGGIDVDDFKWTLPINTGGGALNGGASLSVSRNTEILYYNDYRLGGKVQRHDLATNVPLLEFAGSPGAEFFPEDVIVLIDETVCCLFRNDLNTITWVYHFAADGTILNSFQGTQGPIHHITFSTDSLNDRIWVWYHYKPTPEAPITNLFILSSLDGATIGGFGQTYAYVNGRGPDHVAPPPAATVCAQPRWGSALKGSLVPMMIPPELSGVYLLNPANKHDTYYNGVENRIPTPTIRTSLLGD